VSLSSYMTVILGGTRPLMISAYREVVQLPDELVVSVRCPAKAQDRVVVCTNREGTGTQWPSRAPLALW
jgi:hypothetical protein